MEVSPGLGRCDFRAIVLWRLLIYRSFGLQGSIGDHGGLRVR